MICSCDKCSHFLPKVWKSCQDIINIPDYPLLDPEGYRVRRQISRSDLSHSLPFIYFFSSMSVGRQILAFSILFDPFPCIVLHHGNTTVYAFLDHPHVIYIWISTFLDKKPSVVTDLMHSLSNIVFPHLPNSQNFTDIISVSNWLSSLYSLCTNSDYFTEFKHFFLWL